MKSLPRGFHTIARGLILGGAILGEAAAREAEVDPLGIDADAQGLRYAGEENSDGVEAASSDADAESSDAESFDVKAAIAAMNTPGEPASATLQEAFDDALSDAPAKKSQKDERRSVSSTVMPRTEDHFKKRGVVSKTSRSPVEPELVATPEAPIFVDETRSDPVESMDVYPRTVREEVLSRWEPSDAVLKEDTGAWANVVIQVDARGNLHSAMILESTGSAAFHRSIKKAIGNASVRAPSTAENLGLSGGVYVKFYAGDRIGELAVAP